MVTGAGEIEAMTAAVDHDDDQTVDCEEFELKMMERIQDVSQTSTVQQPAPSTSVAFSGQVPDVPDNSRTVHAVLSNNCSTLHWVRQNLHSSHCVDQNKTLVDLAGNESDVTKAKR